MDPDHDGLTPGRAPKTQSLPPELALIAANALNLLAFLFLSTFNVLEVSRNPSLFSTLVHKLDAVLLERGDGVQREFVVRGYEARGSRNHHRRYSFVSLEEVLHLLRGYSNQVGFDVLGILNDGAGVND